MPTTVTFADGTLCVVDPQVFSAKRPHVVETLCSQLASHGNIATLACDLSRGRCEIRWADVTTSAAQAAAEFLAALHAGCRAEADHPAWRQLLWPTLRKQSPALRSPETESPLRHQDGAAGSAARGPLLVRGPKRLLFLAAGACSTVMTVIGILVPGIPTVPFLLSSSYFLARSSPRAHAALLATPMFGTLVREWDAHQALSGSSKRKLIAFTLVIIGTTVVIAKANPLALGMMAIVAPACVVSIVRLPQIPSLPSSSKTHVVLIDHS